MSAPKNFICLKRPQITQFSLIRFLIYLFCVSLISCLVPMPIEQEPIEPNYPPEYLSSQTLPTPGTLVVYDPSSQENIRFLIAGLDDPNFNDLLYWRVFLNYEGKYYNAIFRSNVDRGIDRFDWASGIQFEVDPCFDFKIFNLQGPFRVELVVADRPFIESNPQTSDEILELVEPNQMLPKQAKSFRVHWMIEYDKNNCIL
jgi:hypothetical protein